MENEQSLYFNIELSKFTELFTYQYDNQNLDNNREFIIWKESILKKYTKAQKLFKCKNDKIIFYDKKNINLNNNYIECPICKKYICYYCSYPNVSNNDGLVLCCFRRAFFKLFSNSKLRNVAYNDKYKNNILRKFFYFIPGINLFLTILIIFCLLFFDLATKKSKEHINGKLNGPKIQNNNSYFVTILIMIFLLSVPLLIYNTFFIILIMIISIPLKFLSIKYLLVIYAYL